MLPEQKQRLAAHFADAISALAKSAAVDAGLPEVVLVRP
jgi:hypothetical protein